MRTQVEQRFENGDPVREYWLARGEGFAVETARGRVLGRVVEVVLDAQEGRIERIVVRSRGLRTVRGRTAEIPSAQVAAAVPARKTFVLDGQRPARARRPRRALARPAWNRLRPRAVAAGRVGARWTARLARLAARGAVALAYVLGALGVLAARFVVDLVRVAAARIQQQRKLARRPR